MWEFHSFKALDDEKRLHNPDETSDTRSPERAPSWFPHQSNSSSAFAKSHVASMSEGTFRRAKHPTLPPSPSPRFRVIFHDWKTVRSPAKEHFLSGLAPTPKRWHFAHPPCIPKSNSQEENWFDGAGSEAWVMTAHNALWKSGWAMRIIARPEVF